MIIHTTCLVTGKKKAGMKRKRDWKNTIEEKILNSNSKIKRIIHRELPRSLRTITVRKSIWGFRRSIRSILRERREIGQLGIMLSKILCKKSMLLNSRKTWKHPSISLLSILKTKINLIQAFQKALFSKRKIREKQSTRIIHLLKNRPIYLPMTGNNTKRRTIKV